MMCFNLKFLRGPIFSFFALGPWAIIHGIAKLTHTFISQIRSLMTPFERYFSEHSENHNIFDIGLWQLNESPTLITCSAKGLT